MIDQDHPQVSFQGKIFLNVGQAVPLKVFLQLPLAGDQMNPLPQRRTAGHLSHQGQGEISPDGFPLPSVIAFGPGMGDVEHLKQGGLFDLVAGIDIRFPAGECFLSQREEEVRQQGGGVIDLVGPADELLLRRRIIMKIGTGLQDRQAGAGPEPAAESDPRQGFHLPVHRRTDRGG